MNLFSDLREGIIRPVRKALLFLESPRARFQARGQTVNNRYRKCIRLPAIQRCECSPLVEWLIHLKKINNFYCYCRYYYYCCCCYCFNLTTLNTFTINVYNRQGKYEQKPQWMTSGVHQTGAYTTERGCYRDVNIQ